MVDPILHQYHISVKYCLSIVILSTNILITEQPFVRIQRYQKKKNINKIKFL